jgi:hypothetical protein
LKISTKLEIYLLARLIKGRKKDREGRKGGKQEGRERDRERNGLI